MATANAHPTNVSQPQFYKGHTKVTLKLQKLICQLLSKIINPLLIRGYCFEETTDLG